MEFKDSPDEAAFRTEVRGFIAQHLPRNERGPSSQALTGADSLDQRARQDRWREALAARGWIAPHWPKEYGGAGMSPTEQFIFNEELAQVRAPNVGGLGVTHIGPILILYGSEEQRRLHLPRVTSGEVQWSQGYSEPGAGSDLAGLQTRAVLDGDEFILNGQKIWSSYAHTADWMFMLARTDPDASKHRGISMFLLDLTTPGITIRPLVNLAGEHHFNEVFFDNVRLPAANLVGELNRGWYIGAALLDFERSMIGPVVILRHAVNDLVELVREAKRTHAATVRRSAPVQLELAERAIEAEIARLMSYRIISMQKRGLVPNAEASISKTFRSELTQRVAATGMRVIGLYGNILAGSDHAVLAGRLSRSYLDTVSSTIAGGTVEINRNVIATRGLGLPRG